MVHYTILDYNPAASGPEQDLGTDKMTVGDRTQLSDRPQKAKAMHVIDMWKVRLPKTNQS